MISKFTTLSKIQSDIISHVQNTADSLNILLNPIALHDYNNLMTQSLNIKDNESADFDMELFAACLRPHLDHNNDTLVLYLYTMIDLYLHRIKHFSRFDSWEITILFFLYVENNAEHMSVTDIIASRSNLHGSDSCFMAALNHYPCFWISEKLDGLLFDLNRNNIITYWDSLGQIFNFKRLYQFALNDLQEKQ